MQTKNAINFTELTPLKRFTVPDAPVPVPQYRERLPRTVPEVVRVGLTQLVLAFVDVEEEDGEVEEQYYEEGQDEDHRQGGENPHQVVQVAEVALHILQPQPLPTQAQEIGHRTQFSHAGV